MLQLASARRSVTALEPTSTIFGTVPSPSTWLSPCDVAIAPKIAESAGIIVSSRKNQIGECASSSR